MRPVCDTARSIFKHLTVVIRINGNFRNDAPQRQADGILSQGVLTLMKPNGHESKPNDGQEYNDRFDVACTKHSNSFEAVNASFHHVASLVLFLVIFPRILTVTLWWKNGFMPVGSSQRGFHCLLTRYPSERGRIEVFADRCCCDAHFGATVTTSAGKVYFHDDLIICGYHMKLGVPAAP